ncbi:hypothetical protein DFH06DRAFT_1185872 [Mycena polygramma]|nr:hypothetical protein DFH06DRAFT_1185872 [Mycena polygramma]
MPQAAQLLNRLCDGVTSKSRPDWFSGRPHCASKSLQSSLSHLVRRGHFTAKFCKLWPSIQKANTFKLIASSAWDLKSYTPLDYVDKNHQMPQDSTQDSTKLVLLPKSMVLAWGRRCHGAFLHRSLSLCYSPTSSSGPLRRLAPSTLRTSLLDGAQRLCAEEFLNIARGTLEQLLC